MVRLLAKALVTHANVKCWIIGANSAHIGLWTMSFSDECVEKVIPYSILEVHVQTLKGVHQLDIA